MQPPEIRTVTVYGASSSAVSERFRAAAFEVGVLIADQGWRQVNGGGHAGMMGAATDGALSRGGVVDAVILDIFLGSVHPKLGDVVVKTNMHDRKRALFEEGDAFVVLPGGKGCPWFPRFRKFGEVLLKTIPNNRLGDDGGIVRDS